MLLSPSMEWRRAGQTALADGSSAEYRESVLPASVTARVVVEAGVTAGWASFAGDKGRIIGIDRFGASAPAKELFKHDGLTVEHVSQAVRDSMAASR